MNDELIILWVAWMSRWGSPTPDHAYAHGVYNDPCLARQEGRKHSNYRGNKYEYQIASCYLNMKKPDKRDFSLLLKEPNYPNEVLIAWVTSESTSELKNITLFLGIFEKDKSVLAEVYQKNLYPNWTLHTHIEPVTRETQNEDAGL